MANETTKKDARAPDVEETNVKETLAANITRYRQKLGLSRAALAKKIGVTEQALGQYERGARTPQIGILIRLSKAFSVPIDDMVEHTDLTYDAVTEFRFGDAAAFFRNFLYEVEETEKGEILLLRKAKGKPINPNNAPVDNKGYVYGYLPLLKFPSKEAFASYYEQFIVSFFLSSPNLFPLLFDLVNCHAHGKEFNGEVEIIYKKSPETHDKKV